MFWALAVLLFFLLLGTPVFIILAAVALLAFALSGVPLMVVVNEMYRLSEQQIFITLPLFTLSGVVLSRTMMPMRLLRFCRSLLGWMPGGMALVATLACTLVTAFTGVTGVTIVALGVLLYPALQQDGYAGPFSLGLLTSSGSLGLLVPPAIPLILFAIIAEIDPAHLFKAGVVPMFLMIALLGLYGLKAGFKLPRAVFSFSELWLAAWDFRYELPVFVLVPVGIFAGFLTAVEAASFMALYVVVVEVLVLGEVDNFFKVAVDAMAMIGSILLVIMASLATSNYLIQEDVPFRLFNALQSQIGGPLGFLIFLNIFLLLLGCMLDIFSAIMIVVPLLLPLARMYGIDLYHLGIIFLVNMQIGYSTPPLGMNLFIASQAFNEPVVRLFRATLPFLLLMLLILFLVTYFPALLLI